MLRRVLGFLLTFFGAIGIFDAVFNPAAFGGDQVGPGVAFALLFLAPGVLLLHFDRRSRRRRQERAAEPQTKSGDASTSTTRPGGGAAATVYGLALVVGAERPGTPGFATAEMVLVEQTLRAPRYPMTRDARITALGATQLPPAERTALEPFVWSVQSRYQRRGGAWQVDFHDVAGHRFLVVYLE